MKKQQVTEEMFSKFEFVYGKETAVYLQDKLTNLINEYSSKLATPNTPKEFVTEKDAVLITYGDSIKEEGKDPLQSLHEFLNENIGDKLSGVHILPFYPFSSDDGFSVIDYYEVNKDLGDWEDIKSLSGSYDLMFDGVINHISAKSEWFQEYLKGNEKYKEYFVEADPSLDYSKVTRPRALPLLTEFETANGPKHVWTTFSEDQIDLNYRNPDLFLQIAELLLFYISKGAKMIRLDAIGFMWKEMGTTCIHLEETHQIIQTYRDVVDALAPEVILITETNVPHKDNVSYFGNGYNEARMVYQFPLPPLTLNTFLTGDATHLQNWASNLEDTTEETTFFNFLASHDGVGVRPVEGILSKEEVDFMIEKVHAHGGNVSYKDNGDGSKSPYELNINYFDALSHPEEEQTVQVKRFLAAQSILLAMAGVPGIYVHSLLGSRNYQEGVEETGRFRSINREKLDRPQLEAELKDASSLRYEVLSNMKKMLEVRTNEKAFHPNSPQQVVLESNQVYALVRTDKETGEKVVTLVNVSNEEQSIKLSADKYELNAQTYTDLFSKNEIEITDEALSVTLQPYEVMWLKG
ncbi:alpha-amylase family glycosyl hydrolase [Sutcliffiella horikoshii]|uniref:alpha-amylase family glycosyl hydrolase n=1 Tax=Sutcliffiella horikoshii TaxID=79883 RepID=UPI00204065EA|nr:alpha-amylase family glycosyl hydrolase [Sutcliffiella horikoshii]MCM3619945.1 alpha-amylase family glycosyl hydrolase [Sutcliffiella horikoshii]